METHKKFKHSAFAGQIGIAREDITPPVGIFCRNWGAAKHDAAEGIHRPITLTAITVQTGPDAKPLVLVDTDLGWFAGRAIERRFNARWLKELGLAAEQFIFAMSHTHSAAPVIDPEPEWRGGELLPAYTEMVFTATVKAAKAALASAQPRLLEWHGGRCSLATNRDLRDGKRIVCGYNPETKADDTLIVGRISDAATGKIAATIVNYACHPTTLAWQNKLVSPDYLGSLRETMQQVTGAPAFFLQGASGELSPRYQYVGDPAVADSHGRQLAYAALSTLEDMEPAGYDLTYDGVVESGAPLATWKRERSEPSRALKPYLRTVPLTLKEMPLAREIQKEFAACTDRTIAERLRRKLRVREAVGDGKTYGMELSCWRVGDAVVIGCLAETYSEMQLKLRASFSGRTIVWMNLINGSIGYLAPAALYDKDVYQVWQSPFERGSLETLEAAAIGLVDEVLKKS